MTSVSESSLKTWYLVANRLPVSRDMKGLITEYVDDRYHGSSIPKEKKGRWFYDTYQANAKGLPVNRILNFDFISPMRCSMIFPNFGPINGTTFSCNPNNILQGTLVCKYGHLQWNGYATRFYDGQLEFYCVKKDAFITSDTFRVEQCTVVYGELPGFIMLYELKN